MMQTRETGCRWCGNRHDPLALCRARRVSRRTFLFTASAAAIGAAIVPACVIEPAGEAYTALYRLNFVFVVPGEAPAWAAAWSLIPDENTTGLPLTLRRAYDPERDDGPALPTSLADLNRPREYRRLKG